MSDQTINGMMWDAEGALWVLTNLGGINYMSKQTKRFDYYSPAYLSGVPGAGEVVAPFCENKEGISGLELKAVCISSMLPPGNFLLMQ